MFKSLLYVSSLWVVSVAPSFARTWSDTSGKWTFEGDLIGVNETTAVVQRSGKKQSLIAIPINQLSKSDQEFLKSKESADQAQRAANEKQTWTTQSGLKVVARVVDYGRRDVTIQRRRGKIYVNDRLFENLNGVQQAVLMRVVSHFENVAIRDKKDLQEWVIKLKAEPRTYTCDGVMLELESGDEYGVPFFLFSEQDLKVLKPGWDRWLAAHEAKERKDQALAEKERESLYLQAEAQAHQRDREQQQKVQEVELGLLAAAAGVTNIWEVELWPNSAMGRPRTVVVPGRDSNAAAQSALAKFPDYKIGSIAKVSR
jgi:hypothetical protein